jgi:hypothetical protein
MQMKAASSDEQSIVEPILAQMPHLQQLVKVSTHVIIPSARRCVAAL